MGLLFPAIAFSKGGGAIEPGDVEALLHDDLCSKDAIESP
jgi:hypothetical protein